LTVTPKTITDYLLETLRNESNLSDFKKWFLGEPAPSQYPSSPWGWVEWIGGRQTPGTTSNRMKVEDQFYIGLIYKHPSHEKAEENIMNYEVYVKSALASDQTLDGNVAYSFVSNREKQKLFMGDHSIVACRITVTTRRNEQL